MSSKGFIGAIAVLLAIGLIFGFIMSHNDTHYTATVTDKQRITTSDSGYYLIFCENEKTGDYYEFKCSDEWMRGKFNSSSFYNQIKVGKTYDFTVVGTRIPLFSYYQNIIDFKEIQ